MSSGAFARGAHSMFSKPMIRKAYHKKSSCSCHDTMKETMKMDAEEIKKKKKKSNNINTGDGRCWVPDERTGIYYPKGQEKVLESIPTKSDQDLGVNINWLS